MTKNGGHTRASNNHEHQTTVTKIGANTSASNNNEHQTTMTRSGETTSASNNDEHRTTMTRDRNTSTSNNVQRKPVSETGAREGRLQTRNRHRGRVAFWAYNLSDFGGLQACLRSEHSVLLGGRTLYIGILGAGASHDATRRRLIPILHQIQTTSEKPLMRRRLIPILHYILGYSRSTTNRKS